MRPLRDRDGFILSSDYVFHEEFQALLTLCRQEPDERTHRFVMADWLCEWDGADSELAREHAGFIREQCSVDYADRTLPKRRSLRRRTVVVGADPGYTGFSISKLLQLSPWAEPIDGTSPSVIVNSKGVGVRYRHGLPDAIRCGLATFDCVQCHDFVGAWHLPRVLVRVGRGGFTTESVGNQMFWHAHGYHGSAVRDPSGTWHETESRIVAEALRHRHGSQWPFTQFQAATQWRFYELVL